MLIKDIMTKDLVTVNPQMSVHALAELLVKKNISGAPVVDSSGKLLGIVREEGVIFQDKKVHLPTFINLLVGFLTLGAKQYEEEVKKITASSVEDIMETGIITVSVDMTLEDAATTMIEKGVYYLPVLDGTELVGVITKRDIVRAIAVS
ncbi:MAG: CBS domain-containing protein [Candidatus Omnitrophota bacterium]|jgi:CBS domain-containing protein